jgi:cytochrome P450
LAAHPEIQYRVQEEIDRVIGNNTRPSYDQIQQLEFMRMVIDETLRLYPPVLMIDKQTTEQVQIGDYVLPADVSF